MRVVDAGDDEDAGPLAQHVGRDARSRVKLLPLEAPGEGDGRVTVRHAASQLGKGSGIHNRGEREWGNSWRF